MFRVKIRPDAVVALFFRNLRHVFQSAVVVHPPGEDLIFGNKGQHHFSKIFRHVLQLHKSRIGNGLGAAVIADAVNAPLVRGLHKEVAAGLAALGQLAADGTGILPGVFQGDDGPVVFQLGGLSL